jgi:hypothetical protein
MKKMTPILIIVVLGLLVGGVFLFRELRRAPLMPPDYDHPAKPVNDWQRSIKIDPRTDYTGAGSKKAPVPERLRMEEQRQRPEEGRN